jgi:hypothetical protein
MLRGLKGMEMSKQDFLVECDVVAVDSSLAKSISEATPTLSTDPLSKRVTRGSSWTLFFLV